MTVPPKEPAPQWRLQSSECRLSPDPPKCYTPVVRVLFVEDNSVFADLVSDQFLRAHEVQIVPSVAEAIRCDTHSIDVVLMDYDLEDGKGDAAVRAIRTKSPDLPIIAVSSHERGNEALTAAGATAVCPKGQFHHIQRVLDAITFPSRPQR